MTDPSMGHTKGTQRPDTLDHIVSYHLPGQELVTLVGLSLWNHDVVRGFEQDTPPAKVPVQHLREPIVDERIRSAPARSKPDLKSFRKA